MLLNHLAGNAMPQPPPYICWRWRGHEVGPHLLGLATALIIIVVDMVRVSVKLRGGCVARRVMPVMCEAMQSAHKLGR